MLIMEKDEKDTDFDSLVIKVKDMLPTLYPQWTDHNISDIGITFSELFAFVADTFNYQLSHISKKNLHTFLRLINSGNVDFIDSYFSSIIQNNRQEVRGVITRDYEMLAMNVPGVKKVFCIIGDVKKEVIGGGDIVYLIVIPERDSYDEHSIVTTEELKSEIENAINPVRMLGVTLKVIPVKPIVIPIQIKVNLLQNPILDDVGMQKIKDEIINKLLMTFDPITQWEIGKDVLFSHLYAIIDQIAGVNYVESDEHSFDVDGGHQLSLHQDIIGFKTLTFDEIPLLSRNHINIEFSR